MQHLSGGELQRVALTICLGTNANVYLIDEPSAYLDAEQRLNAAKVIKRLLASKLKTFIHFPLTQLISNSREFKIHFACKENCIHCGTRLYYEHILGRSSNCLRRGTGTKGRCEIVHYSYYQSRIHVQL